jgi:hypothetical protein
MLTILIIILLSAESFRRGARGQTHAPAPTST